MFFSKLRGGEKQLFKSLCRMFFLQNHLMPPPTESLQQDGRFLLPFLLPVMCE